MTVQANADTRCIIRRAFDTLDPDDRTLLMLRYHDDLTDDEIAQVMDIPPSIVAPRLAMLTEQFRNALDHRP